MAQLGAASLDSRVARAVAAFDADHSPDPDEDLTIFTGTWNDQSKGAAVGFDSDFAIGTYYVDGEDRLMAHVSEEGETFLVCEGF